MASDELFGRPNLGHEKLLLLHRQNQICWFAGTGSVGQCYLFPPSVVFC